MHGKYNVGVMAAMHNYLYSKVNSAQRAAKHIWILRKAEAGLAWATRPRAAV
jgi:hypothetical protein